MTFASLAFALLGIPAGLLVANASEWGIHRWVLHGLGRNRRSFWSFHWHEHHRASRQNDMLDPDYHRSAFGWHAQGKEALALALGALGALALIVPLWPTLGGTLIYSAWDYHRKHKRAHLDPAWAREHLRWHYDHHMGANQNANWCVTHPWFDLLLGTRLP
jgi:hypothetical protein